VALGIRACLAGQRVIFRTATEWVALLADAQRQGRLDDELRRLERYPLLICDEVGYGCRSYVKRVSLFAGIGGTAIRCRA
jgi:DNA replication protein DnaC